MQNEAIHKKITEIIIDRLKKGEIPWMMRYTKEEQDLGPARSGVTGKEYTGINRLLASRPGRYYTYEAAKKAGGQVRKGEKSTMVVFFHYERVEVKETRLDVDGNVIEPDENEPKKYFLKELYRQYFVFNEKQIDWKEGSAPEPVEAAYDGDPVEDAEETILDYRMREGLNIVSGTSDPSYCVGTDTVSIPERKRYASAPMYYLDLFHELVHSTGHPTRLNRQLPAVAARSAEASLEELTAEIGGAFLSGRFGLLDMSVIDSSAANCQRWIKVISQEANIIKRASAAAERAVNYLLTGENLSSDN